MFAMARLYRQVKLSFPDQALSFPAKLIHLVLSESQQPVTRTQIKTNRGKPGILHEGLRFRTDRECETLHLWRCVKKTCKVNNIVRGLGIGYIY